MELSVEDIRKFNHINTIKEARLIREGCPENEAGAEAAKVVAYPGVN